MCGNGEAKPRREAGAAWMSQSRPLGRVWAPKSVCGAFEIPSSPLPCLFLHKHQKGLCPPWWGLSNHHLAPPVPTPPQGRARNPAPLPKARPSRELRVPYLQSGLAQRLGPILWLSSGQEAGSPGNTALHLASSIAGFPSHYSLKSP